MTPCSHGVLDGVLYDLMAFDCCAIVCVCIERYVQSRYLILLLHEKHTRDEGAARSRDEFCVAKRMSDDCV